MYIFDIKIFIFLTKRDLVWKAKNKSKEQNNEQLNGLNGKNKMTQIWGKHNSKKNIYRKYEHNHNYLYIKLAVYVRQL